MHNVPTAQEFAHDQATQVAMAHPLQMLPTTHKLPATSQAMTMSAWHLQSHCHAANTAYSCIHAPPRGAAQPTIAYNLT